MTISRRSNGSLGYSLYRSACLASVAALAGCSSDDLATSKLGNTADWLVTSPDAPPERVPVAGPDGVDGFLIGEWVGHAEDLFASSDESGQRPTYVFPSGSSEIYLTLDIQNGRPLGEVRFGSRDAPEPQAGVPYGAGNEYYYATFESTGDTFTPVEGVAYALRESVPRLAFSETLDRTEYSALGLSYAPITAFEAWCPLQPSLPVGGGFSCSGAAAWGGDDPAEGPCIVRLSGGASRRWTAIYSRSATISWARAIAPRKVARPKMTAPSETLWLAREGDQLIALGTGRFEYGEPGHSMPVGAIRFERVEP